MAIIIIDEFRNALILIILELVLALPYLKKRSRYPLRLIFSVSVYLAFTLLYNFVYSFIRENGYDGFVVFMSSCWYITVAILTCGVMAFCHKANKTEVIWILITAYALQHFIYVTAVELVYFGILDESKNVLGQALLSLALTPFVGALAYFLFVPKGVWEKTLNLENRTSNFIALSVFFAVFFASTFVNQANARQDGINYLSMVSDLINCIFVVTVQYYSLRDARLRYDKARLEIALTNEKKRYETFKNSVDYINIKCHDLKKEIKAMKDFGICKEEKLDEIAESVAVYESFADTGNIVLDTLLTDVNFSCLNYGISFSCIADASGFCSIKNEEIYRLFGNILDNAVEYVKTIEDEEKRFIRLFVKSQGGLKIIHSENYFDGELALVGGIPQTTKNDKLNHGFGMKSVQQIVKKYGGEMQISSGGGLFKIDIVLSK